MADLEAGAGPAAGDRTFLGHPRGLATLFFTEMWERFSFYGMRSLLTLYLVQHFLFSDARAQAIYGSYAALVYLMPVVGGFLADRFLGARKAVTIGAALLVLGHLGMAFEGRGAVQLVGIEGETYAVAVAGRGGERETFLETPAGLAPARFTPQGLEIDGAAAGLPSFVAAGAYTLSTQPNAVALGGVTILVEHILFLSLGLIIVGVGFLKANISTTVGALYAPGDPRRDVGFTIFYMGINLGALFATILCGWLGQTYGWAYGFGLAGIGMALGLVQYLLGQRDLVGAAEPPKPLSATREGLFWVGGLVAVVPAGFLVQQTALMERALPALTVILFVGLLGYIVAGFRGAERGKMVAALVLTLMSTVFWMLFEQAGSSLSLFAERSTDLTVARPGSALHLGVTGLLIAAAAAAAGGVALAVDAFARRRLDAVITIYVALFGGALIAAALYAAFAVGLAGEAYGFTAAMTQSFNPFFVVALAAPVAGLWAWLGKRGREPSTPAKFALALLLVGLGFFVLVLGVRFAGADYRAPLVFLLLLYLFHTTGELFLSPVGLSMITKLSAARVVGLMMGMWFLAASLAHILASLIAQLTAGETVAGEVIDPAAQLQTYVEVFTPLGLGAVAAAGALAAATPWLKRAMGDVR